MDRVALDIPGVELLRPRRHGDDRGWLAETWSPAGHGALGFVPVQDNLARSRPGTLRGLHLQQPPQGKLVQVLAGRVFDVVLDLRPASPAFGQWRALWLDAAAGWQLLIPRGLAHGFCVPADGPPALVHYRLDRAWAPTGGRSLRWSDPALGIPWPVAAPVLSAADRDAPGLAALCAAQGWPCPAAGGRLVSVPPG